MKWHEKNKEHLKIYHKKYYEINKEKIKIKREEYYKKNKKEILEKRKEYKLKKNYGITQEEYNILYEFQDGKCNICGEEETAKLDNITKNLAVDHDHKTGKVRGLLCSKCNIALGGFNDNIKLLKKAIKYLEGGL